MIESMILLTIMVLFGLIVGGLVGYAVGRQRVLDALPLDTLRDLAFQAEHPDQVEVYEREVDGFTGRGEPIKATIPVTVGYCGEDMGHGACRLVEGHPGSHMSNTGMWA
jgi:hypothetical protein